MTLIVGDPVEVKEGSPGYDLWYKGKKGVVVGNAKNDEGELRYLVTFDEENRDLPFAEHELIKQE